MIFLNTTYVSPLLEQTLTKSDVSIYDLQRQAYIRQSKEHTSPILNAEDAFPAFKVHFPNTKTTQLATLFKDKIAFRKHLARYHKNFYFKEFSFETLRTMDANAFPYPLIIKPAIGYSSVGVFRIDNAEHFIEVVEKLEHTMCKTFDAPSLNKQRFLLESYISGQEFAIDMYYNTRLFKDAHDMRDRIYYTSKETVERYLDSITAYLTELVTIFEIEEPIPLHIELRIDKRGNIMPIEINPLRFAGEGTTELGYFAYHINPYDYFFNNKKPDWPTLIDQMDDSIYCFTCAAAGTEHTDTYEINHNELKKQFPQLLDYRHIPKEVGTTFAVIFYKCDTLDALQPILTLDFNQYLTANLKQGGTYVKK